MNSDPKSANKPKKDSEPDDPRRDLHHNESPANTFDEETAQEIGSEEEE